MYVLQSSCCWKAFNCCWLVLWCRQLGLALNMRTFYFLVRPSLADFSALVISKMDEVKNQAYQRELKPNIKPSPQSIA